ncbi:MAG: type III-B CRISPR module-associated Cmr3 family protein [Pseudomonadota bacterium]
MTKSIFIEPLDVLLLRGNKLFGDPGSFGEALIPPWPSVAAGAIRSRMLADGGVDLAAFARGEVTHPVLGTPTHPGDFAITAFHLARRHADGRVEALVQPPVDLVIVEDDRGKPAVRALVPTPLPHADAGLQCSAPFARLPVLAERERGKPASGYWLSESGWRKYLAGELPAAGDLVKSGALWSLDHRVGVGLDVATRRAAEGRLFSMQAVAMKKREHAAQDGFDVGFLATVSGAEPPTDGLLRFGGDGRAAAIHTTADYRLPESEYGRIAEAGRCRLVLATPGLFEQGWLPTGTDPAQRRADGSVRFELRGVAGWIVCAAVARAEVISGWDLARWEPKAAQRAAPTGSVWWLELDPGTDRDALRKLVENGLWPIAEHNDPRRAEGFNCCAIAAY